MVVFASSSRLHQTIFVLLFVYSASESDCEQLDKSVFPSYNHKNPASYLIREAGF